MAQTILSAATVKAEIASLKTAWQSLGREAATFGVNILRFAQHYTRTYEAIRQNKDERGADTAVKSLNAAIGIDDSKASIFRGIAGKAKLFGAHKTELPGSLDAMYQVAQLTESRAERLFENGRIHPALTVREARLLRPVLPTKRRSRGSSRSQAPLNSIRLEWSATDSPRVLKVLRDLLTECETSRVRVADPNLRQDIDQAFGPGLRARIEK